MKVTAQCIRDGRWWAVEVPEVEGAFTQARRLDQVPSMAADVVSLLADIDPEAVDVRVVPLLDDDILVRLETAARLRAQAVASQTQAAHEIRAAARALREQGLSLRDVGTALGVSYQRAHQLLTD